MSLFVAAMGLLGLTFSRLGAGRKATGGGSPPADTIGQPMGLLLALTYPS